MPFIIDSVVTLTPWVTPSDLPAGAKTNVSVDDQELACETASTMLYEMSGARYGDFQATVRPRRVGLGCSCGYAGTMAAGTVVEMTRWACACASSFELLLDGTVQSVDQVKVDGVALQPSEYVLYDKRRLVRRSGPGGVRYPWPCCQDIGLASTEPGTFELTYTYGQPVPPGGTIAARMLAAYLCQQLAAAVATGCALATKTTQISRQNVSVTVLDPQQFIKEQLTPIPAVNMWLVSVNPNKLRSRARAYNPEGVQSART